MRLSAGLAAMLLIVTGVPLLLSDVLPCSPSSALHENKLAERAGEIVYTVGSRATARPPTAPQGVTVVLLRRVPSPFSTLEPLAFCLRAETMPPRGRPGLESSLALWLQRVADLGQPADQLASTGRL